MSSEDYVKYMTQKIVKYMDTPKEERQKQKKPREKEHHVYSNRWFGVLPFAFRLFLRRKK
ncbi:MULTISPECIES: YqzE family protein [Gracilibacillus]|uniref:YqzE family protein n=1 Tax=Gracilibacillus dipsosauri TaxID=178340 RepID=A0A317KZV3_9BACI|nr:YqzE family protein [Gracilibacillus dipsosauri]PWU68534.1 YqzE family protein [Gracilibacillus dipsosauri]